MRKNLLIAVKLTILVLVLVWICSSINRDDWNTLVQQEKNWGLLAASLVAVLVAHVICYLRWYVFVHALQIPISMTEAIKFGFLGNLFNFVSLGSVGGDLFRAIAAALKAGKKRPEVIASVLVDRIVGLLGLTYVTAFSLQLYSDNLSVTLDLIRRGTLIGSVIGTICLALVTFAGHHLPIKLLNRIPMFGHALHRMASAGMLFEGRPALVGTLLGMTAMVHSLLTVGMYLISISLYAETPSLAEHFLTVPPAFAAAALPLTPGGVGVQEMAVAKLIEELPILPAGFNGLIVAVMFRIELIVVAVIGGIYYLFGAKEIKRIQIESVTHPLDK